MINVTRTFLPPFEEYIPYLSQIWDSHWVTNNGPLVKELEASLKKYLGIQYLQFTSNGTIALQLAIKAMGLTKKIITTPFSYVATTSSILWEGCIPVFADIDPETLCLDPDLAEAMIDEETEAILATHVFGLPCNVERFEEIGKKHGIKIIYDAAHAFGCVYKGRSLLSYGDMATCSFHATKLFHTGEGGCIISHEAELNKAVSLKKSFGHVGDEYFTLGINGKNSELHAAMGLAVLPHTPSNIEERRRITEEYDRLNAPLPLQRPAIPTGLEYNYAYYPVLFADEPSLLRTVEALKAAEIVPRRYFWPSLENLSYIHATPCPVSDGVSSRILCLPLYNGLGSSDQVRIIRVIESALK
ncbi:MAG: aminotransferase DegT [Spirochaetes bacterium GWB1_59_5]|nr:MAG: aminotransferase DegT [Spirochaetes bacterium GWB1_59_5]